jgi:hypothetical protein
VITLHCNNYMNTIFGNLFILYPIDIIFEKNISIYWFFEAIYSTLESKGLKYP